MVKTNQQESLINPLAVCLREIKGFLNSANFTTPYQEVLESAVPEKKIVTWKN